MNKLQPSGPANWRMSIWRATKTPQQGKKSTKYSEKITFTLLVHGRYRVAGRTQGCKEQKNCEDFPSTKRKWPNTHLAIGKVEQGFVNRRDWMAWLRNRSCLTRKTRGSRKTQKPWRCDRWNLGAFARYAPIFETRGCLKIFFTFQ